MTNQTQTRESNYSDGSELIPAEVIARSKREGNEPPNTPVAKVNTTPSNPTTIDTTSGYTVDQEGLVNNYAVMPETYKAKYPSEKKQQRYLVQGAIAAVFVGLLIVTAFIIS
ncbi:MAG: ssl1498 family light-harvesting-like protein [Symploca sp. SIO2B6]|nr:ssl1498 family light-harvesting-like protein [Symploca sp. SIO2B6]